MKLPFRARKLWCADLAMTFCCWNDITLPSAADELTLLPPLRAVGPELLARMACASTGGAYCFLSALSS